MTDDTKWSAMATAERMLPEDMALFCADPDYAATLGIAPRCVRCGGPIREVWGPWNGEPLVHAMKIACDWMQEGEDDD